MPYFFRCDYCNEEQSIEPWDAGMMARNCDGCGQDMCVTCHDETEGFCDSCARKELKRRGEELLEREDEQ